MIGLETHMLLKHYLSQGMSRTDIARKIGLSERTIRRWIAAGELGRNLDEPPAYRSRPPVASKLDPYKRLIAERLEAYPDLSAVRIMEEIEPAGYTGSYALLQKYIATVRPRPTPEPVVRFETPAGHQTQVDFAEFRLAWGTRYALMVVLGYSRLLWLRFYQRQDMRTLFAGLEEAFEYFGGVTREVLFDQMKAVITADLRMLGKQLVINEEFIRFAAHHGFRPRACRAYRAQTKGKVERPIAYVRNNLVYARDFISDAHLDEELGKWLERANSRVHGTTREVPRQRFERDERHLLLPLAPRAYRSLVLASVEEAPPTPRLVVPRISVEKRPLSEYATLIAAGA